MIIAIDASRAVRPQPTGTEHYSARIIQYLAKIDKQSTYYLYTPTPPPASFPTLPTNFIWKVIPFPRLWTQIRLSLALWQDRPDILFVPAHVLPLYLPKRTVITIHDLAYEIFPEAYGRFARWYNRISDMRAVRQATAIITPSQATKQDLTKLYGAPSRKVTVIPLAVDQTKPVSIPKKIMSLRPFFLMLGRLEARKNTLRAIQAYTALKNTQPDLETKLVLVGKPGYGYEAIQQAIADTPKSIQSDIIEVGYADAEDVAAYRQAALALVYPSLHEGFGLPLLEAMAANLPIIASDSSAIPEVVDDAAILVSPDSTEELQKAMAILATNELSRQEIAKRGAERVKQFSWEKTAEATLAVLKGEV